MGNVISLTYDVSGQLYDRYYPKSRLFRPIFLSSGLMAAAIGYQLWTDQNPRITKYSNLIFLYSAGANLGMQIWVSFISGMTMIRLLPRHQFGLVQANLFPKFFFLSSLFSYGSLSSFLTAYPVSTWKSDNLLMGSLLVGSFVLSLANSVWLNIKTISFNQKMHQIEKNAGEGITIIGKLKHQNKVESDPEYQITKRKFGIYHSLSLTANALTVASTLAQFYLLGSKHFFSL
ncbi:unnamed protein product [Brachionus calyciflorus]|uniref:Transmembrane protein 205 n=1 Tax=Brachionus calyciflorus TaxID=104777 RepID=A0A813M940_9BILA|nr:unnamed protein product [Brachionus calyciflorus]